jgi:AAA domain
MLINEEVRCKAEEERQANYPKALPTQKHGEVAAERMKWMIRNRLPETGAGLLEGQWGVYKTFITLNLSAHAIFGWDWTGEPVYRQCGVLAFAPEGGGSIAMRFAAHIEHKILPHIGDANLFNPAYPPKAVDIKRLPFEWVKKSPLLLGTGIKNPLPELIDTALAAHDRFMHEHDLPLGLIWIDTMATAAGWTDESDNAEASRVMAVLRDLSTATGALALGIDHFGKNADAGARGASAKEANSDFLLAALGERELSGSVKNTRLALRKLREGPQGLEIPYRARIVDMGQDERGYPVTSVVIDWQVADAASFSKGNAWNTSTLKILRKVLMGVLAEHGSDLCPFTGEPAVRGVDQEIVRTEFYRSYPADGSEEQKKDARRTAFKRSIKDALGREVIGLREVGLTTFIWLTKADDVVLSSVEILVKKAGQSLPKNAGLDMGGE